MSEYGDFDQLVPISDGFTNDDVNNMVQAIIASFGGKTTKTTTVAPPATSVSTTTGWCCPSKWLIVSANVDKHDVPVNNEKIQIKKKRLN